MAFAIGYAVVRLLLVALYVRARLHVRGEGRRLVDIYIVTFTFTACLGSRRLSLPAPSRFLLWGLALGLDLCVPPFAWRTLGPSPIVVSHLTERFGQFFIVVLGQSVAAVVAAVAGFQFSLEAWVAGRSLLRHRALPLVDLLRPRGQPPAGEGPHPVGSISWERPGRACCCPGRR